MVDHSDWQTRLERVVRNCKAEVIGHEHLQHLQHALVVITALEAFGEDKGAQFFIEGQAPKSNIPRPDLILLHPDLGIIVIENKGIRLQDIHQVENTMLHLTRDGHLKREDPFKQAETVMFGLKDQMRTLSNEVLLNRTAALPRIGRSHFNRRFNIEWPSETLFEEECNDAKRFRERLTELAMRTPRQGSGFSRLSPRARNMASAILNGNGVLYGRRRTLIESKDRSLLGAQIEDLELGLKKLTHQQVEWGKRDLRGKHQLFRGVAGSGKSIMLAMNVSSLLLRVRDEENSLFEEAAVSPKILVVCFNRALVQYLREKIETQYSNSTGQTLVGDDVTIVHFEGLIRLLEKRISALQSPFSYEDLEKRALWMKEAIAGLSDEDLKKVQFDAVYIDEAQDLDPLEIELLLMFARKDESGNQSVVIFYDNAQNIFGVKTPVWQQHGVDIVGRTVFLDLCLRNTRQTLEMAFNVLVGSFAPENQRVTTREFADLAALRQRKLIEENGDRLEVLFARRIGPQPIVKAFDSGREEVEWVVAEVNRLIRDEKVQPNDIMVLYKTHHTFKDSLPAGLERSLRDQCKVRLVDSDHWFNKDELLIEDGFLAVSTIASAKGYDASVVFLLGADELATDTQGRASFYVAATRAKLQLIISGVRGSEPTLLNEIIRTSEAYPMGNEMSPIPASPISVAKSASKAPKKAIVQPRVPISLVRPMTLSTQSPTCKFCQSKRVHGQHGRYGYFFKCIDCLKNTKMAPTCPKCGVAAKVRKSGLEFFAECEPCKVSDLLHRNVRLEDMEE